MALSPRFEGIRGLPRRSRAWLGYWKWALFDGGHREIARVRELRRLDRHAARQLDRLAPIALDEAGAAEEVHLLCGHAHTTIGLWSLWSLLHWSGRPASAFLHDDGSLTPEDRGRWGRLFPGLRIVGPAEAVAALDERLPAREFPRLRAFRERLVLAKKLVDFHLFGSSDRLVLMDTDILFFRRPDEFLALCDRAEASGSTPFVSFRDVRPAYVADDETLAARFSRPADRFNSGMCLVPRFDREQFRLIEEILGGFEPEWLPNHWAEQTVYALLAGRGEFVGLSDDYQIVLKGDDPVAVHYVSGLRRRFYTEGIVAILARLAREGAGLEALGGARRP